MVACRLPGAQTPAAAAAAGQWGWGRSGSFQCWLTFGAIQHGLQRLNDRAGLGGWQELQIRHRCACGATHEGEQGGGAAVAQAACFIELLPEPLDLFGLTKGLEAAGLGLIAQLGHVSQHLGATRCIQIRRAGHARDCNQVEAVVILRPPQGGAPLMDAAQLTAALIFCRKRRGVSNKNVQYSFLRSAC